MSDHDPNKPDSPEGTRPGGASRPLDRRADWLDDFGDLTSPRDPLDDDDGQNRSWAELPQLDLDQVSGSMSFCFPVLPSIPEPPAPVSPESPTKLPPPPGLVVVNDDFAALHRLSKSNTGTGNRTPPSADQPPPGLSPLAAPELIEAEAPPSFVRLEEPSRFGQLGNATRPAERPELLSPPAPIPMRPPLPAAPSGQPVVYGMVVRNSSNEAMYDVRVEHELPPGPRFLAAQPEPQRRDRLLIWEMGTLEPGSKHRFKVTVQPNRPGELPADATALFRVYQCAQSRVRILRPAVAVVLSIPGTATVGERIPVVVEANNGGRGSATELRILIPLPAGLSHPDGPSMAFQQSSLGPGERCRFEGEVAVEQPGVYSLQAQVVGNGKQLATGRAILQVAGAGTDVLEAVDRAHDDRGPANEEPFVVFALGEDWYAVPAAQVIEVNRAVEPTPLPDAPGWLIGTVRRQERDVPLIDLRCLLELPAAQEKPGRLIRVGSLKGNAAAALLVDRTIGLRDLTANIVVADRFAAAQAESDGRTIVLLDLEKLLQLPELRTCTE